MTKPVGIVQGEEGDPAHVSSWGRGRAACSGRARCVLPLSRCDDDGVPELRRAPEVLRRMRRRLDRSLAGGAQEIGLQLDGREPVRALGQVRDAAVAAGGVGERHDGAGMQVAVRRDVMALDREFRAQFFLGEPVNDDAHVAGQEADAAALELLEGDHAAAPARSIAGWPQRGRTARRARRDARHSRSRCRRSCRARCCRAPCAGRARARHVRVTPRSDSSVVRPNMRAGEGAC